MLIRALACLALLSALTLASSSPVFGQFNGVPPEGASCLVSAGNRNAPLAADGSYVVYGIPGDLGAVRARVTCSDGSVGQSGIGFTSPFEETVIDLGPIEFGRLDLVPVAVELWSAISHLTTGETAQLQVTGIGPDGSTFDATPRSEGTTYGVSNPLMATVSDNGLVTIFPQFAEASSSRVVTYATAEGSVSSTFMFTLGPRGSLQGQVRRADGISPAVGARVSVSRLQPREHIATVVADAEGQFLLEDVHAGRFHVSVIDPQTGDRGQAFGVLSHADEVVDLDVTLSGQGVIEVNVINALDESVEGAFLTLTSLGNHRSVASATSDENGGAIFAGVTAGTYTLSARDPASGLIAATAGTIEVGETLQQTLALQPVADIAGRVLGADGETMIPGVQVRLLSRERGVLSQFVTGDDGRFTFDTLPLSDGPYILDAFIDGRLRARVPGVVLSQANQTRVQDVQLMEVGVVSGRVTDASGTPMTGATVTMQSLEGLRLSYDARVGEGGRYTLPAVPIGDFELTALTADGQIGRELGRIDSDGQRLRTDITVGGNTLVGTVYERDGSTPVGANVAVYLVPQRLRERYSYDGVNGVTRTFTDESGAYAFDVAQPGGYIVQAESGLERGRTSAVLASLDPSQPLVVDLAYLPKGTVHGVVRDDDGNALAGARILLQTNGVFQAPRETITDGLGRYAVEGVFAGPIAVTATVEAMGLSGTAGSRLDAEGQSVELDIVVAATGGVTGQVIKRSGNVVPGAVELSLYVGNRLAQRIDLADGTAYNLEHVPLGDFTIHALEVETGDQGVVSGRINSADEVRQMDVRMVGQGFLDVLLLDAAGEPVEDAVVSLQQSDPFRHQEVAISDEDGLVEFDTVVAGDFVVSATTEEDTGRLTGSATGTMIADTEQSVTITMQATGVGTITGVVVESDGVTPVGAGMAVRMTPEPIQDYFLTHTDPDGRFTFEPVDVGEYVIDVHQFYIPGACPERDRIRGRANEVTLSDDGEEIEVVVQLIGSGEVNGTVTLPGGQPASGVAITLTNPDPVYGANVVCGSGRTDYRARTNQDGQYLLADVPPGDFTIDALSASREHQAQAADRVRFDGDIVTVDMELVPSAVTLPRVFHDANGLRFEVSGRGGLDGGTNRIFDGAEPNVGGMLLDVVIDGIAVPFMNGDGTLARLDDDEQTVEMWENNPSGLRVTRRITVPRAGYFSRYIELLENPTDEPITVGLRVRSNHRESHSNPRVVDSSNGDQQLSVDDPDFRDTWVVIDDQTDADPFAVNSIPATIHLFDGDNGERFVTEADYSLIGQAGHLSYQWSDTTVEPGSSVALMHVVAHQLDRQSARAAALRLASLPPELVHDIPDGLRQAISNFDIPAFSAVEPLPNLAMGNITGTVYSGDGVTEVPQARVTFRSKHPLFGRARQATADAEGQFEFQSRLDGSSQNAVIPVFGFDLEAEYQRTGQTTARTPAEFPAGAFDVVQDLIFIGRGDVAGRVERPNGAFVPESNVRLCTVDSYRNCGAGSLINSTTSGNDGSYLLPANPPGDYYLLSNKPHPQQVNSRGIRGRATVTVTAADRTVVAVIKEETGSIAGRVFAADGTPLVNAEVSLYLGEQGRDGRARRTHSDTAGAYRFFDAPLGMHQIRVREATGDARGFADVEVQRDIETEQDISVGPFGAVEVEVRYARGALTPNARVRITGQVSSLQTTDINGRVRFDVPTGEHTIRVEHPDDDRLRALDGHGSALLTSNGEVASVEVSLPPAGGVVGTMVRPDGSTLAGGFPYQVEPIDNSDARWRAGFSDQAGNYNLQGLPLGRYRVIAFDPEQDRYADAEFDVEHDGQAVEVDLVLLSDRIALPADLFDANRFRYDVQRSGNLAGGSGAYADEGGAQLHIDGQAFVGATSARLQAGRRQFAIDQDQPIAGLNVTRKIYSPLGSYFARYLEVLENPGDEPITVALSLSHSLQPSSIIDTATGGAELSVDDAWLVVDDAIDRDILLRDNQSPPTAYVIGSEALPYPATTAEWQSDAGSHLHHQWQSVTVAPGETVALMHFVVQQVNRDGARAAAQRLVQMPPEAIADLTDQERAAIINFAVPVDGESLVDPLPSLVSRIDGVVYEGDARTPVGNTYVTVQSSHPLFNRRWGMRKDRSHVCRMAGTQVESLLSVRVLDEDIADPPPVGSYFLQGRLQAEGSIAVPEGYDAVVSAQRPEPCFGEFSGHPFTHMASRVDTVRPQITHDVLFDSGILTGTVVGAHDYSITGGRLYRSIDDPDPPAFQFVRIGSDGAYDYRGLPPGTYDLLFDTPHPQGSGLRGQRKQVVVTQGEITVTDVQVQPTGSLQGAVVTSNGEPSIEARVIVTSDAADQDYDQCAQGCSAQTLAKHKGKRAVERETKTDSLGRYAFSALPTGAYRLTVVDPISGAYNEREIELGTDHVEVENVILMPLGSANLQINRVSGEPMADALVYLHAESQAGETVSGRADMQGRLTVANVPEGSYQLRITDPRHPGSRFLDRIVTGSIDENGQENEHLVTMGPAASLLVSVIDSDADQPLNDARIYLSTSAFDRQHMGRTNAAGQLVMEPLPEGSFTVESRKLINGSWRSEFAQGEVRVADDGQQLQVSIDMRSRLVPLPRTLTDANRRSFTIRANGSDSSGRLPVLTVNEQAFTGAALALELDGARQYLIRQEETIDGLSVSRMISVPENGYYAQFVEVLENTTDSAVLADVQLDLATLSSTWRVQATASGATDLNTPESWLTVGGNGQEQETWAWVLSQHDEALLPHHMSYESGIRELSTGWQQLEVPAEGRVVLVHHIAKQFNADAAVASAERLAQLPPEVLQTIPLDFAADTANQVFPPDMESALEALPRLDGRASGRLLEGDGETPVANRNVHIRSQNLLFHRNWSVNTDADGAFNLQGEILGNNQNVAIPLDAPVAFTASHPTGNAEIDQQEAFAPEADSLEAELVFAAGGIEGQIVNLYEFSLPQAGGSLWLTDSDGAHASKPYDSNGHFSLHGLAPGTYQLRVTLTVPSGTNLTGEVTAINVTAGNVEQVDLAIEPNGAVSGVITDGGGQPLAGAEVYLSKSSPWVNRALTTNEAGHFLHGGVPAGDYNMRVRSADGIEVNQAITVQANQTTERDVQLIGQASATVTVRYARGESATNVQVWRESADIAGSSFIGRTDANGQIQTVIAMGDYSVRARHPDSGVEVTHQGVVSQHGEHIEIDLDLLPSGSVRVRVSERLADDTLVPVPNAAVEYFGDQGWFQWGDWSDAAGEALLIGLVENAYAVFANDAGGRIAVGQTVVDASVDGQTIDLDLIYDSDYVVEGELRYNRVQHLRQIAVQAGDAISIGTISRVGVWNELIAKLFTPGHAPDKQPVASAQFYQDNNGVSWRNQENGLGLALADSDGFYTLAVGPAWENNFTPGEYRLVAMVNGVLVELLDYQDGGTVEGTLFAADGQSVLAGATVRLETQTEPALRVQTQTDENGQYRFENVPVDQFVLHYIPDDDSEDEVPSQVSGEIAEPGDVVTLDLLTAAETELRIQLRHADGEPMAASVALHLSNAVLDESLDTDSNGFVQYLYRGDAPLMIRARHPDQGWNYRVETWVEPAHGQVKDVDIVMTPVTLQGTIRYPDGSPVDGARIQARYQFDGNSLSTEFADDAGEYQFAQMPIGSQLVLWVRDPRTEVEYLSELQIPDEFSSLDVTLAGFGEIAGQVRNPQGHPLANTRIELEYPRHPTMSNRRRTVTTDADGYYLLDAVPVELAVSLSAELEFGAATVTDQLQTELAVHGAQAEIDFELDPPAGSIGVNIIGADGLPLQGNCWAQARYASQWSTRFDQDMACEQAAEFAFVPVGEYRVDGRFNGRSLNQQTVAVVDGQTTQVDMQVPLLVGNVTRADATPVAYAEMNFSRFSENSWGVDIWGQLTAMANEQGYYRIPLNSSGQFQIRAIDLDSGLAASATGTRDSSDSLVSVNLSLPPAGLVSGVVSDESGNPVAGADVRLRSSGLAMDRRGQTDASGGYQFPDAALGDVLVSAVRANSQHWAQALGELHTAGQSVTVNPAFQESGSITGVVTDDQGQAVVDACVELEHRIDGFEPNPIVLSTRTDSEGRYRFDPVAPGETFVTVKQCDFDGGWNKSGSPNNAAGQAVVNSQQETELDLQLDGSRLLPWSSSAMGYVAPRVDLSRSANVGMDYSAPALTPSAANKSMAGADQGALSGLFSLMLNSQQIVFDPIVVVDGVSGGGPLRPFKTTLSAPNDPAYRVVFNETTQDGFTLARSMGATEYGEVIWLLDEVTNLSDSTQTLSLDYAGLRSDTTTPSLIRSPQDTNHRYAILASDDIISGHVFAGANHSVLPQVSMLDGDPSFSWSWQIELQPQQSIVLLYYVLLASKDGMDSPMDPADLMELDIQDLINDMAPLIQGKGHVTDKSAASQEVRP